MRLSALTETLRFELTGVAALGDEHTRAVADQMAAVLEGTLSMRLLELTGQLALEVSGQLPSGRVEVRLAGQDPEFVYVDDEPDPRAPDAEELSARITLRLSEALKNRVEEAAAREGLSVNSWLVRALARATSGERRSGPGRRLTGFGRS
jgi:hypothetical protein